MSFPIQPANRNSYLDVLRGLAISGVLIAYMLWNIGNVPAENYTALDNVLEKSLGFLLDSKCFTILAHLFAIGFVMHMNKAGSTQVKLATYRRRLLGLIILGLLHALLLRNGDILLPYAMLMLIVVPFYRASTRTLVLAMIITFLCQVLIPELWNLMGLPQAQRPVSANGNYWVENFEWVKYWYSTSIFFWEITLMFLFGGLIVGKYFIEKKTRISNRQLFAIIIGGLAMGYAAYWTLHTHGSSIYKFRDIGNTKIFRMCIYVTLWFIHRVGLAVAYASIIYLLVKRFPLKALAVLGRTSLSNYLLQAVIIVPVCLVFDLFDRMTPTLGIIIAAAIWIVQVVVSTLWLKTHRYGPVEWLLRRFTYGKKVVREKDNAFSY